MKNVVFAILASALFQGLIIGGCSNEKERLADKVLAQTDSISTLQRNLQWKTDSLQSALVKLSVKSAALDTQMQATAVAERKLRSVTAETAKTKDQLDRIQESHAVTLQQRDSSLLALRSDLSDTAKVLGSVRAERDQMVGQLSSKTDLILKVRPWYYKWRHDATERNFLEKLFGADKAKAPDYPEPDFKVVEAYPDSSPSLPITTQNSDAGRSD